MTEIPHQPATGASPEGAQAEAPDGPAAEVARQTNFRPAALARTDPAPGGKSSLPDPAASGTVLTLPARFGDYELLEEIARGGMGVVYKARQLRLDRVVALKMILQGGLACPESVQRFHREARAAAALAPPHIVAVYDNGELDGRHYFTMAHVEGASLRTVVKLSGLPPLPQAVAWLRAVTEAVAFAHQHGIIHRDLKPENVLLDGQGRPRVTDFGLAKRAEGDPALTGAGEVLGTPAYMAPEQALGKEVGPAADVYSLGGILYFLVTGQPPSQGRTVTEVLYQVVSVPPTPPSRLNPKVPPELEAVCLRCLAKAPADRYPSAEALLAALRDTALRTNTVAGPVPPEGGTLQPAGRSGPLARPKPPSNPSWGPAGRRPRRVGAGLAAAGWAARAAGLWLPFHAWAGSREQAPTPPVVSGTPGAKPTPEPQPAVKPPQPAPSVGLPKPAPPVEPVAGKSLRLPEKLR